MNQILIGRDPSCNVVLNSPNVSRHHALLDSDGYNVTITDLNSTNGTYVNGVRINSQTILQPNDVVAICGNIIPWQQYINQLSTTQNAQFIGQNSNIGTTKRGSGLLALWISLGSTIFVASVIGIVLLLSSQAKQQNIDEYAKIYNDKSRPAESNKAIYAKSVLDYLRDDDTNMTIGDLFLLPVMTDEEAKAAGKTEKDYLSEAHLGSVFW